MNSEKSANILNEDKIDLNTMPNAVVRRFFLLPFLLNFAADLFNPNNYNNYDPSNIYNDEPSPTYMEYYRRNIRETNIPNAACGIKV